MPADDGPILAARLREARQVLGLTQYDVASALNLPRSAISAIENGNRGVSGIELRRLGRLYRRPLTWLLGDADPDIDEEITVAVADLSPQDQDAVISFARFLAHQAPR
jgi:transcriptional regulator with XRE-family HTH domain